MHEATHRICSIIFAGDHEGNMLLQLRAKKPNQGMWTCVGGKLRTEIGESPLACALRELREETGVEATADALKLFAIVTENHYEGGDNWLMFLFRLQKPLKSVPPSCNEGRHALHPVEALSSLDLPPVDKNCLWPLYFEKRKEVALVSIDCQGGNDGTARIENGPPVQPLEAVLRKTKKASPSTRNWQGKHFELPTSRRCAIMGILNLTPDSFYAQSRQTGDAESLVRRAREMVQEGADLLDLGAESTRPGHTPVGPEEELQRLLPSLRCLSEALPGTPLSVDTQKACVAEAALRAGAHIINDINGLQGDPEMAAVVGKAGAGLVIMHNQAGTHYDGDLLEALLSFFRKSLSIAQAAGIAPEAIALDPGIGFGKTREQNLLILRRLGELRTLGYPLLLGTSRKSVIGLTLALPAEDRLEGTLATSALGIQQGARILRVHDVQANLRLAKMTEAILHA